LSVTFHLALSMALFTAYVSCYHSLFHVFIGMSAEEFVMYTNKYTMFRKQ